MLYLHIIRSFGFGFISVETTCTKRPLSAVPRGGVTIQRPLLYSVATCVYFSRLTPNSELHCHSISYVNIISLCSPQTCSACSQCYTYKTRLHLLLFLQSIQCSCHSSYRDHSQAIVTVEFTVLVVQQVLYVLVLGIKHKNNLVV